MKKKPAKSKRPGSEAQNPYQPASNGQRPRWDRESQELWLGQTLLKRFRRPAPMAILILDAFEEEGWPRRIDDPLPPNNSDSVRRDRLRHQVQNLNRRLDSKRVRFSMDGTGQGIVWNFA